MFIFEIKGKKFIKKASKMSDNSKITAYKNNQYIIVKSGTYKNISHTP